MVVPVWPATIPTKEAIIDSIGRDAIFYTVYSSQACPDCSLDPVTDESTDSFCETCSGVYWIPVWSGSTFTSHITWKFSERQQWESVGIIFNGDCLAKIMYSEDADDIVSNAKYVVVDNRIMDIDKITYRGATEVDRIIVDLKERDKS